LKYLPVQSTDLQPGLVSLAYWLIPAVM
jgi:hypothetical protein